MKLKHKIRPGPGELAQRRLFAAVQGAKAAVGAVLTLMLTIDPHIFGGAAASSGYNLLVTVILILTVVFANYAEAVAEGRGRAQAATLRKTKKETPAKRVRRSRAAAIVS